MSFRSKSGFLSFLLLHLSLISLGQEITQTVRGTVTDKESKYPLVGAAVALILDTTVLKGTATDLDGKFKLTEVPLGRYTIQVSYLGYNTLTIPNVVVNSAKEVVLSLTLEESVEALDEVVIKGSSKDRPINEMATISARLFTIEETQRYAGSWDDPARMAANFAGIRTGDDTRNDIIIRGNSPAGLLWRVNGIDIPNPNHFALFGTTGGPVSILNNNTLSNSDFLTGAFPAEYGNALAGVFDLKMKNGNNEQREFTGELSFLGMQFLAEGPFAKGSNASYLFSYRYSTLELMKAMGIGFGVSAIPKYQDATFKLNFPTEKAGTFSLFGLGGISDIELLESERDTSDWTFGQSGMDVRFGSRTGTAGLTHLYLIDNKTYIRSGLSVSYNSMYSRQDSISASNTTPIPTYRNKFTQTKYSYTLTFNKKFSARHSLRAGVYLDLLYFDLADSSYNPVSDQFDVNTNFNGNSVLLQPYIQWKYKISDQLVWSSGLHYQHFFFNDSKSLEPRTGLRWQFAPKQSIGLGYGLHSQLQPIYIYFQQMPVAGGYIRHNAQLDFTKSHHFVLGYDHRLGEHLRLKAEVYYQHLYNVPVNPYASSFSLINEGGDFQLSFPDSLVNDGTGRNYGIELTLERFFDKGYYFLLTTSFFESRYKGSDGVERSTDYNGNFVVNLLGGKEFKLGKQKRTILTLAGKITTAGGRRYTPIDIAQSRALNVPVFIDSLAYSEQYPTYFRADIKISIRRNSKKISQEWGLDVTNVFNTQNVLTQTFIPGTGELRYEYQLGLLPVFKYRIEF